MIAFVRMVAGLIVWTVAFCLLYGLHGIGCAAGWPTSMVAGISLHRIALLAAWIVCLVAGALVAVVERGGGTLVDKTAHRLALVGLVATAITGLPVLVMPACL